MACCNIGLQPGETKPPTHSQFGLSTCTSSCLAPHQGVISRTTSLRSTVRGEGFQGFHSCLIARYLYAVDMRGGMGQIACIIEMIHDLNRRMHCCCCDPYSPCPELTAWVAFLHLSPASCSKLPHLAEVHLRLAPGTIIAVDVQLARAQADRQAHDHHHHAEHAMAQHHHAEQAIAQHPPNALARLVERPSPLHPPTPPTLVFLTLAHTQCALDTRASPLTV